MPYSGTEPYCCKLVSDAAHRVLLAPYSEPLLQGSISTGGVLLRPPSDWTGVGMLVQGVCGWGEGAQGKLLGCLGAAGVRDQKVWLGLYYLLTLIRLMPAKVKVKVSP